MHIGILQTNTFKYEAIQYITFVVTYVSLWYCIQEGEVDGPMGCAHCMQPLFMGFVVSCVHVRPHSIHLHPVLISWHSQG